MAEVSRDETRDTMVEGLRVQATELWGKARASQITSTLEQTAQHLSVLADDLPRREEEPAFFL